MELRNAASAPFRWFPATFIDGTSTFEFAEEERLQLHMKFLYPEYLCGLSAVVDAAAPSVAEAQATFVADAAAPPPPPSAFDAAEALLTQLVAMQVQQCPAARHMLMMLARLILCCSGPRAPDVGVCVNAAVHRCALLLRGCTRGHCAARVLPHARAHRPRPRLQFKLGAIPAPAPPPA